jgi:hypothetical protein
MPTQCLQKERKWDSTHLRPTPPLRPAFALIMKEVSRIEKISLKCGLIKKNVKQEYIGCRQDVLEFDS